MKALVYHGPDQRGWDTVDDPSILAPTDAIVRIDTATICGTDLHILKGDVPETTPGTILGHEAVGTVLEIGASVTTVAPGDRVLMSCISSCGRCRFCKEGRYGQCLGGGGWIFGHLINGVQADYARVPFADNSVYKIPEQLTDEQVLFLADILPTSYEVGVLNGQVTPGDVVAIVGAGPIGLAAILTARLYTPGKIVAIDLADSRLESAKRFGADVVINNGRQDAVAEIMELTDGLGADSAFEAVGVPETFELAAELVRPGGRVANIGVHGKAASLHLEKLWIRDVTITTGLVDTFSIPQLMRLIASGRLDPTLFATHRFSTEDTMSAYDTFSDAANTGALKVVLFGPEELERTFGPHGRHGGGLRTGRVTNEDSNKVRAMSDDWRLRVHLPGDVQGKMVAESLDAMTSERDLQHGLSDRVAVSHDDDDVFVYAATREDVEAARDLVASLAAEKDWQVEPSLARWHPVAEEWEDPDKPLPTGGDELAAERAELIEQEREESQQQGYPDFEVRVHCRSRSEAIKLQERLSGEGIPSARRWHYLLIGAPDEDTAAALAERIRAESPPGTEVTSEGSGRAVDAAKPANPFAIFGGLGG